MTRCAGIAPVGSRILVGGLNGNQGGLSVRLFANGTWDQSYGQAGFAYFEFGDFLFGSGNPRQLPIAFRVLPGGSALYACRGMVGKIDSEGRPVRSFGHDGLAEFGGGPTAVPMRLPAAIGVDGRGMIYIAGDNSHPVVAKLSRKGIPQHSFGKKGIRQLTSPGRRVKVSDLKLQSDGKLVLSGYGAPRLCVGACGSVYAYRLEPTGRLDRSFGRKGLFNRYFGGPAQATTLSLSSRGMVLGGTIQTSEGRNDTLLARIGR